MRTYLECIPCFFRQALEASALAGADEALRKKILDKVAEALPGFSLESSPPLMAKIIHSAVKEYTLKEDPYAEVKAKSNALALGAYAALKEKVATSGDRLGKAVEIAIAGNIIDFGAKNRLNVQDEINNILEREADKLTEERQGLFEFDKFKKVLKSSASILYLADNAGETVFDRVLLEQIRDMGGKRVIYAVKESPIINDALRKDAIDAGLGTLSEIISSGSDAPGTLLDICSSDFLERYNNADMVISKGQGNFEALSSPGREVFYLFMAKCPIVARSVNCEVGDIILTSSAS